MNNKNYDVQYLAEKDIPDNVNNVDVALSPTSTRPVQNRVIYNEFLEQETRIANNESAIDTNKLDIKTNKQSIAEVKSQVGVGIATLVNGKVPTSQLPDVLLGQVAYSGTIDQVLSNIPYVNGKAIPTTAQIVGGGLSASAYFIPSMGSYVISNVDKFTFDRLTLEKGDWLIWNGNDYGWGKVDNTDAVVSVAGMVGSITREQLLTALNVYTKAEIDGIVTDSVVQAVNAVKSQSY